MKKQFGKIYGINMNITNEIITEYLNKFYFENTNGLSQLRKEAEENRVPIILRDTELLLKTLILLMKPQNILEIGTAVGYSSSFFASLSEDIQITTIESNEETYNKAINNINKLGYKDRINVCLGDAREVLEELKKEHSSSFDFVFIDAAKSHYRSFWDLSIPLIKDESLIVCDNILMKGMTASDEYDKYKRHKTNIRHMRDFLDYINNLDYAQTTTLAVGDGLALSIINKRRG